MKKKNRSFRIDETYKRQIGHKLAILCVTCLCAFLCAACGATEEEIPMGRYAERQVKIPVSGVGYSYAHPLSEGGYYLCGEEVDRVYVAADGTSSEENWGWQNSANIRRKTEFAIADSGAVVFAYFPKFYTQENQEEIQFYYYYVGTNGEKYPLELQGDAQKGMELSHMAFAPDEQLYASIGSEVCRIDATDGRTERLFETEGIVDEFAFLENIMIALDGQQIYLYDMEREELLEANGVLDEFVATHQSGGRILLAVDDAGEEGAILYLGCHLGLYRYVWGGSLIEQIADGQLLTFGNSQYTPLALQVLPDEEFRVFFSGDRIVELYYDETIPAKPSRELMVYSLEENGIVRYAAQLFMQENPDVLVKYETGIDGDYAVSKEDAVKNLNTRLLAGEGPDILVMDDMDMEQYAEKGILKELDDLLAPYTEEGLLYQNIVEGMRMTDKKKIYGVPMTVYLPLWYGEEKYLESEQGLVDIIAGAQAARAAHPDGPLLSSPYARDLLNELIPVCLPAWTDEDGALQTEKIKEFYLAMESLWALDSQGLTGDAREKWQQDYSAVWEDPEGERMLWVLYGGGYLDSGNIGETWLVFCQMESTWLDMQAVHLYPDNIRKGYVDKAVEDEVVFGKLAGQAQNVYWAENIVSLCEQSKEPELAEKFMELLLSEQMMNKWWLNGKVGTGIAIRKDSLENILDIENTEYAQIAGWNSYMIGVMYHEAVWPDEEEKQWLYQMMEEASCCYRPGTKLEEVVKEVGLQVLDGSLTPEEGAAEVARKMAIEMEE